MTGAGREWTVSMISELSISLKVDAGHPQIAMPELPLDNDQRHALVRELYGVSMPELMGREASTDAGRFRRSAQLFARCRRLPARLQPDL